MNVGNWKSGDAVCVGLFVLATGLLYGQSASTAALTVTVLDPSGATIAGANLTVTNTATNQSRNETSGANGSYTFTILPVGSYKLSISASGFKTVEISPITLNVTETRVVTQKLEVGTQQQQVTVSTEAASVQTETSEMGSVTGEKTISTIPLVTRNFTQILALNPGVVQDVANASSFGLGFQDIYVNGQSNDSNNFQLDGVQIDNFASGVARDSIGYYGGITIPNPDAIQEFKVLTSTYDASYGRNSGSNVNVLMKSGSNVIHGSVFEYFRNDDLNANNFFSNRSGVPRGELRQNQFGFSLGGPARKDKLFYFLSYQGTRQLNGVASQGYQTDFLPPQLTNDRSAATLGSEFCPSNNPAGSPYANTFGGGVQVACNGSNINQIALNILNFKLPSGQYYIPTPQTILNPGTPQAVGFSAFTIPAQFKEDQAIGNFDYLMSSKETMALRYVFDYDPATEPFDCSPCLPGSGGRYITGNHNLIVKQTSLLAPNLVNEAHFSYFYIRASTNTLDPLTDAVAGITQVNTWQPVGPILNFTGLSNIGSSAVDGDKSPEHIFEWADNLSWTHGRHTIRTGFVGQRILWPLLGYSGARGSMTFQTFPDFLLGMSAAQNGSAFSNVYASGAGVTPQGGFYHPLRVNYAGAFVQDDIKINTKLTLNLGLRWEYDGLAYDANGNWAEPWLSLLETAPIPPLAGTYVGETVPNNFPGTLPAGVFRRPTNVHPDGSPLHDFAPRVGFAWQPLGNSGRFVVRGGYGWFYDRIHGNLDTLAQNGPPLNAGTAAGSGAANALATETVPFFPVLQPGFPSYLRTPTSKLSASFLDEAIVPPLVQNFNLNIQFAITPSLVLEASYVGSRGERIQTSGAVNEPMLATASTPVNCATPVTGCVTTNTAANAALRVPILGYNATGLNDFGNQGDSNYHSLQTVLRKRFSRGLQFQASYTFSRAMSDITGLAGTTQTTGGNVNSNDPNNRAQQYGPADFNRPQRFVINYYYDFPNFHDNKGFAGRMLTGWAWSGVTTVQAGLPITLTDSRGGAVYGFVGTSRAQICPGMTYGDLVTSGGTGARLNDYFNLAAICTTPIVGTINGVGGATGYGNMGRGIMLGPGQFNFDTAAVKAFKVGGIHEDATLQFRSEFFNVFNHPQFSNPATNVAATSVGVISTTSVAARIIQFALRYSF